MTTTDELDIITRMRGEVMNRKYLTGECTAEPTLMCTLLSLFFPAWECFAPCLGI